MGFHFPPEIEALRQRSELNYKYDLPDDSNVRALPIGPARRENDVPVDPGETGYIIKFSLKRPSLLDPEPSPEPSLKPPEKTKVKRPVLLPRKRKGRRAGNFGEKSQQPQTSS
jgi:hypothetical protein